jgi:hypothetical protein
MSLLRTAAALLFILGLAACDGQGAEPLFPADYASTYTEVRNCRTGGEHELGVIRVLADPAARDPYLNRDQPIPQGAVLLKEEYDFSDTTCSGDILRWTVMARLEQGSSPDTLDWRWQTVDPDRSVVEEDAPRCHGCHSGCTPELDGYEGTCTVP